MGDGARTTSAKVRDGDTGEEIKEGATVAYVGGGDDIGGIAEAMDGSVGEDDADCKAWDKFRASANCTLVSNLIVRLLGDRSVDG